MPVWHEMPQPLHADPVGELVRELRDAVGGLAALGEPRTPVAGVSEVERPDRPVLLDPPGEVLVRVEGRDLAVRDPDQLTELVAVGELGAEARVRASSSGVPSVSKGSATTSIVGTRGTTRRNWLT